MTIEQAKECLESIDILKYRDDDKNYFFDDVKGALDIAIKSLDMWDKVLEELEQEAFNDVNGSKFICVNRVNQIINKHLKEIEE
jgi:hypothetical protein